MQAQVRHTMIAGEAATCSMVMLELWNGAQGDHERNQLKRLSDILIFLDIDDQVWSMSWQLAAACRRRGVTIPSTDILIIAVAQRHEVQLIHSDKHYDLFFSNIS